MKKFLIPILAIMSLLFACNAYAAPAYSKPKQHIQPDGSVIDVYLYGDENYHFYGDKDGYALELNDDGAYEYVTDKNTVAVFSAEDGIRPSNAVKGFDLKTDKADRKIVPVPFEPVVTKNNVSLSTVDSNETPSRKETKMLVIAIEFEGEGIANKFDDRYYSPEKIYEKFFGDGEGVSSVDSYYTEVSGGRQIFVPAFELPDNYVVPEYGKVANGVIKVKLDYENPGTVIDLKTAKSDDIVINNIIMDAMVTVDSIIDFREYNTNGIDEDGVACLSNDELILSFVMAGYEASGGNKDNSVWAHSAGLFDYLGEVDGMQQWSIYWPNDTYEYSYEDEDGDIVTESRDLYFVDEEYQIIDGMIYFNEPSHYAMMGAMFEDNNPMGIGSFCHELGHVLGLPDLYDTVNSMNHGEISTFSLMCAGSWGENSTNAPASSPTHLDPWCKIFLGWYNEDELVEIDYNQKINIDILTDLAEKSGCRYVKVNTKDPDEYFLVENRSIDGYDQGLKYYIEDDYGYEPVTTGGIAIWHIDNSVIYEEVINEFGELCTRFEDNSINVPEKPGIRLIRHSKDLTNILDNGKPLWSFAENDMSMFGKKSDPASTLNTYTDGNGYSGVEMQFMSEPSDEMRVYFGHGIAVTVSRYGDHTTIYAVNDSDETVTVIPFIDKFLGGKHETYELTPIVVAAGETGTATSNRLVANEEYTIFFIENSESDTTVHVHNGTAKDINITPIIVDEGMNDIYSFHSDVVSPGGCISESAHKSILDNKKKYKMYSLDLNTLKPLSRVFEFEIAK